MDRSPIPYEADNMYGDPPFIAVIPILIGLIFLAVCFAVLSLLPLTWGVVLVGLLLSAATSFVILVAMPRASQLAFFGAAVGVTADGAYATFTDQTPITVANGLVRLATSLTKAVGIVAANVGTEDLPLFHLGVWSFIISAIVFMGASFLIKHEF